jgi:glycosyltransferase involved in cell wall biosynthesis
MFRRGAVAAATRIPGGARALFLVRVLRDVPRIKRSGLFDREYYEAQTGREFRSDRSAIVDYIDRRGTQRPAPHPLVEPEWCTPVVDDRPPRDPAIALHRRSSRHPDPGPLFHMDSYRQAHPESVYYRGGPLAHFLANAGDEDPLPVGPDYPGPPPTWGRIRRRLLDKAREYAAYEELRGPRRSPRWDSSGQHGFVNRWSRPEAAPELAAAPPGEDGAGARAPWVTVVMPVRNRPVRVLTAIESVRAQTFTDWELIVVDDGSTDGTARAVSSVADLDPRITLVRIPPSGVSAARNVALDRGRGRFVAFLDSDNTWVPHFLQVMLGYLVSHELRAGYSVVDAGPGITDRYLAFDGGLDHLLVKNHIDLNSLVADRELVVTSGGFDPGLRRWVDHDLVIKISRNTTISLVPFVGVAYDHDDDATDRITRTEPEHWQYRVLANHLLDWSSLREGLADRVPERVSVCMPTYQDWELTVRATRRVLEAADLLRGTDTGDRIGSDVEVIILDNGSRRSVSAILSAVFATEPRVRLVSMPRNLNFSIGSNLAFAASTGETVVFLNNDTEVFPGWVEPLADALADPEIRGAQPLLLYPDGTVQSAGTVFPGGDLLPSPLLVDHAPEDVRRVGKIRLTVVTAAALAMRAADVVELEGFDPMFVNGFEDVDLCLRAVQAHGGAFAVVPDSVVMHHESRTPGRSASIQANRALWLNRWRGRLPAPETDVYDRLGLHVAHLDPGPPPREAGDIRMPRPVLYRPARQVTSGPAAGMPSLRWALKIAAHAGMEGNGWGDVHFADALARALERLGQEVVVDRREAHHRATAYLDDVVLNIRGLEEVALEPGRVNLLWVISHPELVTIEELLRYDVAFAASIFWADFMSEQAGRQVIPLQQATDPARFDPRSAGSVGDGVLFVGNSRNVFRPIVRDAMTAGLDLSVYGRGWERFELGDHLKATQVDNDRLGAAYASADVVLCDHWDDMADSGFVSNRIFDAVACGARVVSDRVDGLEELFGDSVRCYDSVEDLARLCGPERDSAFPDDKARLRMAEVVRKEHSFDARALTLLEAAVSVRERQGWLRPTTQG